MLSYIISYLVLKAPRAGAFTVKPTRLEASDGACDGNPCCYATTVLWTEGADAADVLSCTIVAWVPE